MAKKHWNIWSRFIDWWTVRKLGFVLLFFAIAIAILGYLNQHASLYLGETIRQVTEDFYANASTELVSIALTVLLIDYLNERRAERELKAQLIREVRSSDNGLVLRALEELRARGWLYDGTLAGAQLYGANLQRANLENANLEGAKFWKADLRGAVLSNANLKEADFSEAHLVAASMSHADFRQAILVGANLQGALMPEANLQGAFLGGANLFKAWLVAVDLRGADLHQVNLQEATINFIKCDEKTILPNCFLESPIFWSPREEMNRFVDPTRLDFWRGYDLSRLDLSKNNFKNANLQAANLCDSNLLGANLSGADLQGAWLLQANLRNANFKGAKFNEKTKLPDGSNWKLDTDLKQFTAKNHPSFWQPTIRYVEGYRVRESNDYKDFASYSTIEFL